MMGVIFLLIGALAAAIWIVALGPEFDAWEKSIEEQKRKHKKERM